MVARQGLGSRDDLSLTVSRQSVQREEKSVPDVRYMGKKREREREGYVNDDQRKTWIMSGDSTVRT